MVARISEGSCLASSAKFGAPDEAQMEAGIVAETEP